MTEAGVGGDTLSRFLNRNQQQATGFAGRPQGSQVGRFQQPSQPSFQSGIAGFSARSPGASIFENAGSDLSEMVDGYKTVWKMLQQEGVNGAVEIAKALPGALAQSYTRWKDAYDQGRFTEMVHKHPVEFVQDFALPLSVVASGGAAGVAKVFGTGATAAKVARALQLTAKYSDRLEMVSDPIGGTAAVGLKKAAGLGIHAALSKPKVDLPKHRMPIDIDDGSQEVGKSLVEQSKEGWNRIRTSIADANHPIVQMARNAEADRIARDTGKRPKPKTLTNTPLERKLRVLAGIDRQILQILEPDKPLFGEGGQIVKGYSEPGDLTRPIERGAEVGPPMEDRFGFKEVLDELGPVNFVDYRDYAVARRTIDLSRRPGAARGLDVQQAQSIVKQFDPNINKNADPAVHSAWTKLRQLSKDRLTYYRKSGLISKMQETQWNLANPNYVPFSRTNKIRVKINARQKKEFGIDDDYVVLSTDEVGRMDVTGLNGNQLRNPKQIIKQYKGSMRMIMDPISSDALLHAQMFKEAKLNEIMQEVSQLADIEGSGVSKVDNVKGIPQHVTPEEISETMGMGKVLAEINERGESQVTFESPITRPEGLPDDHGIVFKDGARSYLKFDDPAVAQAFGQLRFRKDSDIDKFFTSRLGAASHTLAKAMRAGVTNEPGFILFMNTFRDTWQAMSYSPVGFVPVVDNMRALAHYFGRTEMMDAWARSGGMQAHLTAADRPILKQHLEAYMGADNRPYLKNISSLVKHPLQVMQALQEASEASTRLGVFNKSVRKGLKMKPGESLQAATQRARQEGVNVDEVMERSAVASRDATTDFALAGADPLIRAWNSHTAFQNAHIQGLDLFRRKVWEGTAKERAMVGAKMGLTVTLPSLVMAAANWNDPEFAEIPEIEKYLFNHIRMPDWVPGLGGKLIRTPKPHEVGVLFGTLPVNAVQAMAEADPSILTRSMKRFIGDLQPLSFPTAIKPSLEVASGHSFFYDSPLTPRGQKQFTKSQQRLSGTTELASHISAASEWINGGKAMVSPIEVDHLIGGHLGTLGRTVTGMFDSPLRSLRGSKIEAPDPKGGLATQIPVVQRILSNRTGRSQSRTEFFDIYEDVTRKFNTMMATQFRGDRRKFLQENKTDIRHAKAFESAAQNIFKMLKHQKTIRYAPHMSGPEKRSLMDRLDEHINRLAKRMVDMRKNELRGAR